MEFYNKKMLIVCFFFSIMWDIKCLFQFTGIRRDTINVKGTKFDINVSQMQNPIDFTGEKHSKSIFNSGECLMIETTERQKYCVNICIKKQRQSNHGVSQVSKSIVIFGTIEHRCIIKSNK